MTALHRSRRPDFVTRRVAPRCFLQGLTCLFVGLVGTTSAQPPAGYYSPADGLTGVALRSALHGIIDDHTVIPYDSAGFDVRDALEILDEDPADPSRVILLYSGASVPKSTWPGYNREHVWPVSLGAEVGTPAYSDVHHLFFCDADVNSERSNRYYDWCAVDCSVPTEAPGVLYDFSTWEPPDAFKGDVARVLFYVDVRYSGDVGGELDLELVNAAAVTGCECMSWLDTLLAWHVLDPVDARELERNDLVFDLIQGNRNPFVDHPEWVAEIWDAPQPDAVAWVNELHYDNSGADVDEGIEIAGPAGTSLLGWTVVAYNGNGFEGYEDDHLAGVIPDEGDGYGALWFPFPSLQNGSPDGVAIVDAEGEVVEFLSYEGVIDAVSGPAVGLLSVDIGVAETTSTPIGQSLQRIGSGAIGVDFVWDGPLPHSRGLLNALQSFTPPAVEFVRGDCNVDGGFNIADAIGTLDLLFSGAPAPGCPDACDSNGDGALDVGDVIFTLGSLFSGGSLPPAPHPTCGPATEQLGCSSFPPCP